MRIIAGEFRGRKILPPASEATRPVTDRVKQSIFDILSPRVEGSLVYDCFSGTGSMGLESLSRGAARAIFFESDRSALQLLRRNIQQLGLTDRSEIVGGDIFVWASTIAQSRAAAEEQADLIFFDPPYAFLRDRRDQLAGLAKILARRTKTGGTMIFRHHADDRLEMAGVVRYDQREYGSMAVEFYRPAD